MFAMRMGENLSEIVCEQRMNNNEISINESQVLFSHAQLVKDGMNCGCEALNRSANKVTDEILSVSF